MRCKFCGRRGERGFERYTDIPVYMRCAARKACAERMQTLTGSGAGRQQLVIGREVVEADTFFEPDGREVLRVRLTEGVTINTYSDVHGGDVEWFLTFEEVA